MILKLNYHQQNVKLRIIFWNLSIWDFFLGGGGGGSKKINLSLFLDLHDRMHFIENMSVTRLFYINLMFWKERPKKDIILI